VTPNRNTYKRLDPQRERHSSSFVGKTDVPQDSGLIPGLLFESGLEDLHQLVALGVASEPKQDQV
jgi:hypothetical protein